jgi:hypothetical protein
MVCNTQKYWDYGLYPSSGVPGSRNTTFRKLHLFPSSGERGVEDTYSIGPLRDNLKHWTWAFGLFPSSGILENRNTSFRRLDLFPSSGEVGRRHLLSWAP